MSSTGYVWDSSYLGHETRTLHPEHPLRVKRLDTRDICLELPGLKRVKIQAELGLPWVKRVHDETYIRSVRGAFASGRYALDRTRETLIKEDSYDVALMSAAGTLSLVRDVADGTLNNGFAAVRPPGHHASQSTARGFCIFNNAAACARFAQQHFDLKRVLIVDWDVHPGDGTAHVFYEDPDVHVVSVHQLGLFPTSVGHPTHTGQGEGVGATWHAVVDKGTAGPGYFKIFTETVCKAAAECNPDFIIISCGFDAHATDPIGGLKLDEDDYVKMTIVMQDLAEKYCGGKLVSLLEGGYNPTALRNSMLAHIGQLMAA